MQVHEHLPKVFNIKTHTFIKMNWTELIGGAAMSAVIRAVVDVWKITRREKLKVPSETLARYTDIYNECMKPVLDNTYAMRFTISRVEDSGGPLIPGADVFVSIINEDYQRPLTPIMDLFQKWRADKHYIELLRSVCENGSVAININDLPDDSKQKRALSASGIQLTEVYFIAQTKTKLFIASISTPKNTFEETPRSRLYIEASINRLRNIFAEYHKK